MDIFEKAAFGTIGVILLGALLSLAGYVTHLIYTVMWFANQETIESVGYVAFLIVATLFGPLGVIHGIARWFIGF